MAEDSGSLELYIVRHAYADHADPSRWPDDSTRPLTEKGAERFGAAARGLRRLVPDVDVVLSSGYARAWQTAEVLRDEAGWPEPESCPALEAVRPPSAVLDVLRGRTERSIALVGHEPQLSRLTSLLCAGDDDELSMRLKKGGVVRLSIDGEVAPGVASLRWLATPKILRSL